MTQVYKENGGNKTMNKAVNFGERLLAEGVSVSNDTRVTGLNNNDLIIGGTGSGKTGGYIFQLLLNPHGSIIVSETKGQLNKIFGDYLKSKGIKVKVLDLVHPENSMAYNPLDYIGRDKFGKYLEKDIKKLAKNIVPVLDKKDPFWERAAARYITILIAYVLEALPEKERNFVSVVKLHQEFLGGVGRSLIDEWAEVHPDNLSSKKYKEMCNSKDAEKMWISIMEFANEALDPFSYKEYNCIFGKPDEIGIGDLGLEQTVLFVNTSDNDISFNILANILYTQAFQTLMLKADENENGALSVPVRVVLDDFAASPTIDNFDNLISVIRSRNISVSVIIQSISQMWTKYNNSVGDTIMNNCDHILYLSGHDQKTADYLSYYLDKTKNKVLTKKRDEAILITDGEAPKIVKKLTPYPVDVKSLVKTNCKGDKSKEASNKLEDTSGCVSLDMRLEINKMMKDGVEMVPTCPDSEQELLNRAVEELGSDFFYNSEDYSEEVIYDPYLDPYYNPLYVSDYLEQLDEDYYEDFYEDNPDDSDDE